MSHPHPGEPPADSTPDVPGAADRAAEPAETPTSDIPTPPSGLSLQKDPGDGGAAPPDAQSGWATPPGPPAAGYGPPPVGYPQAPGYAPAAGAQAGYPTPPGSGYPPPQEHGSAGHAAASGYPAAPGGYAPQGGYPPPPGSYPPPGPGGYGAGGAPAGAPGQTPGHPSGYPGGFAPPGAYPPPGQYTPPPTGPSFDPKAVSTAGWGVLGAALLSFLGSFFPFWTWDAYYYRFSFSGWSSWWWLPVLLASAVGVVYALQIAKVITREQVKPLWLFYGAAASFVLMLLVLVQTFVREDADGGPGFGVFFVLLTTAALTYFTALIAQKSGARLPVKVPGPS